MKDLDPTLRDVRERRPRVMQDAAAVVLFGATLFVVSHLFDLFPLLAAAADRHQEWWLGEASVVLTALSVGLAVFSVRRTLELNRETRRCKTAEDKLSQKSHELESVFRAFPDLYFRLDSDGTVLDYQTGRLSDLYVEPKALQGRRIEDVLPSDVSRQFHDAIIQVHKTNALAVLEYSLPQRGRSQSFEVRLLPFERRQIIAIFRDITARKDAEEKLKRYAEELTDSNEELKIFAYIVSHDLRSPLVNIKGFAGELGISVEEIRRLLEPLGATLGEKERLKLRGLLEAEIPEALSFIGSAVKRMDNLTNAILKLSRLGRRELRIERIESTALAQSVVRSLGHQIAGSGATVTVAPLPPVMADSTAMEQIFGNLIDNALKYHAADRPGLIEISAESGPGEATFHVRDNGRGIAENDLDKVFEIFRRVGRQDVPGEGMGLAYVKSLVRRHGGRIWVESAPNVGTTFSFTLPIHTEQGSVTERQAPGLAALPEQTGRNGADAKDPASAAR